MLKKTKGVEDLVRKVLLIISKPYSVDITEDVCLAIENNQFWRREYDDLVNTLGKHVVNRFIGIYTKQIAGLDVIREVKAKRSKIIETYTKLR